MTQVIPTATRLAEHPPLRAVDGAGSARSRAELAVAELLTALGRDLAHEHLAETPRRVVESLIELTTPPEFEFTTFENTEGYTGMVLIRDIPFHSLCQHHLLPFRGVAHIGYLPGERLLGLSKIPRVLERFARDLQLQERLTQQVATFLHEHLMPRGVGVVMEAEHLCMSLRGVQTAGAKTVTSSFLGLLETDHLMRSQFEAPAARQRGSEY